MRGRKCVFPVFSAATTLWVPEAAPRGRSRRACARARAPGAPGAPGPADLAPQPADLGTEFVPTYGSDTVLHRPATSEFDDHQLLCETGDRVINILFDCDEGPAPERDRRIISQLQQLG